MAIYLEDLRKVNNIFNEKNFLRLILIFQIKKNNKNVKKLLMLLIKMVQKEQKKKNFELFLKVIYYFIEILIIQKWDKIQQKKN